jgi:hypothetical protein
MYDFNEQLIIGQRWEQHVESVLVAAGYSPTALNRIQQKALGADFVVTGSSGQIFVECKRNTTNENQFFIEVTSGKNLGCAFTSKANFWVWQLGEFGGVAVLPPAELRLYFAMHSETLKLVTVANKNNYNATGCWVNVRPHFSKFIVPYDMLGQKLASLIGTPN